MSQALFDLDVLVRALRDARVRIGTFGDEAVPRTVILRHDVDVDPWAARRFADMLRDAGLRGTFFIRCRAPFYDLAHAEVAEAIEGIARAGHAVGLHWEGNADAEASLSESVAADHDLFTRLLPRGVAPVRYVSLHRPANGALGARLDPPLVSAYGPPFFGEGAAYFSDSGARFDPERLRGLLADPSWRILQVLAHPEWWTVPGGTRTAVVRAMIDSSRARWERWLRDEIETFRDPRDPRG